MTSIQAKAALQTSKEKEGEDSSFSYYRQMANAVRFLAIDAIEKAKSGHPGLPMGMADVATVLFKDYLKFDPQNPTWPDRDRFVLSAGHGSMLLYALLYLTGYKAMTLDQLQNFRQLGSLTPGHPEVDQKNGIETTTGPLGQGIANAVGMALAETHLAAEFGSELVDHYTYAIVGDGDLMEGISHEACSLAGHLKLSKLIVFYDDNKISIDGPTDLSFSDNTLQRFEAYGWDVKAIDGHAVEAIKEAIEAAKCSDKPSLIACRTIIGYGAPNKSATSSVHGAPLGEEEILLTRKALNWPYEAFETPIEILTSWREVGIKGAKAYRDWQARFLATPLELNQEFKRRVMDHHQLMPEKLASYFNKLKKLAVEEPKKQATRQASGHVINYLMEALPELMGGSADLTPSNNTRASSALAYSADKRDGRYIHYGVREHAMAAMMNGMALHRGILPFGGTFLCFSDYCRSSIRLSALMKQHVIYVMTHDSIGLGEDGPTHQPVEHLASLRAMPNLAVYRPCDLMETIEAWEAALANRKQPSLLVLSRQAVEAVRLEISDENLTAKGAYLLREANATPEAMVTLFATGTEVGIALEAREMLEAADIGAEVVSVPCWERFKAQESDYQRSFMCKKSLKVAIEAGISQGWEYFIGPHGLFIGMDDFGASAPASVLYKHFGITAEAVVKKVKAALS